MWVLCTLAAAYADPKVGRLDDAHNINKQILALDKEFSLSDLVARAPYKSKEQADRWTAALRRAGLPE